MRKVLALALLFLAGCGGGMAPSPVPVPQPTPITLAADQVFGNQMVGQRWTFKNAYGDLTWIDVESPAQAEDEVQALTGDPMSGNWLVASDIVFHYTKDGCRPYWQPGVCRAQLWFVLRQQQGEWVSIASLIDFPEPPSYADFHRLTADVTAVPGMPTGYVIVPARGSQNPVSRVTAYLGYPAVEVLTFDSVLGPTPPSPTPWRTDAYVENVTTPVYSGPALVSEQWEGPCFPAAAGCAHEKWYFAPGLGLVKVAPLDAGTGRDDLDPKLTMTRTN